MRTGYSVIELLLALLISSLIAGTVLFGLNQIQMTFSISQDVIDLDSDLGIIKNQLQKDLEGAFVPLHALTKKDEKKEKKNIKDIFVSTNKEDSLSELTFFSTNAVQSFDISKSRAVRIVYHLEQQTDKKNLFRLVRQEGKSLSLEEYKPNAPKKIRAYELADTIKKMSITYSYPRVKDEKAEQTEIILEKTHEWNSERADEEKKPLIPTFVQIDITLQEPTSLNEIKLQMLCKIESCGAKKPPEAESVMKKDKPQQKITQQNAPSALQISKEQATKRNTINRIRTAAQKLDELIEQLKT